MLAEFLEVLRAVRERAQKYKADLEKSEALTRYVLIDPVLRVLGWDTKDPECVQPEFSTDTGKPDYALLWEGTPLIMVEAKALHANLGLAKDKGFQYCWKNKVRYFAITDGERWEIYDMEKMGGEEIAVANLSENLGQAARQLLALWRPAMPKVASPPEPVTPFPSEPVEKRGPAVLPPTPPGAITLAELLAKAKRKEIPYGSKPPALLRFPDGKTRSIKHWRDLLTSSVEWVAENGLLSIPIKRPSTGKVLVATTPEGMRAPKEVRGYYVETHASYLEILRSLTLVLDAAGIDPKEFRVILRD